MVIRRLPGVAMVLKLLGTVTKTVAEQAVVLTPNGASKRVARTIRKRVMGRADNRGLSSNYRVSSTDVVLIYYKS